MTVIKGKSDSKMKIFNSDRKEEENCLFFRSINSSTAGSLSFCTFAEGIEGFFSPPSKILKKFTIVFSKLAETRVAANPHEKIKIDDFGIREPKTKDIRTPQDFHRQPDNQRGEARHLSDF
jgi:hypothetical protein